MFKYALDIPKGATHIVLPNDKDIVIFAATVVNEPERIKPAGAFYHANNTALPAKETVEKKPSLLKQATIIAVSGECNDKERAVNLTDGNLETKWCDVTNAPNYVVFDLGQKQKLSGWRMVSAGCEENAYITRTCLLQARNTPTEEWKTIDILDSNQADEVARDLSPVETRYLRLYVVGPTQEVGQNTTRIYELEVY